MEKIIKLDALCVCVSFIDELSTLSEQTVRWSAPLCRRIHSKDLQDRAYAGRWTILCNLHRRKTSSDFQHDQGANHTMKAYLMFRDHDFNPQEPLPVNASDWSMIWN